jgi:hypothetical protein
LSKKPILCPHRAGEPDAAAAIGTGVDAGGDRPELVGADRAGRFEPHAGAALARIVRIDPCLERRGRRIGRGGRADRPMPGGRRLSGRALFETGIGHGGRRGAGLGMKPLQRERRCRQRETKKEGASEPHFETGLFLHAHLLPHARDTRPSVRAEPLRRKGSSGESENQ